MAKLIDLILGRSKLKEDNARLEWLTEHNNGSYMRIIAEKDAEIKRLKSVVSEVIADNIYHETDEEFNEIYRRYLYGGDVE